MKDFQSNESQALVSRNLIESSTAIRDKAIASLEEAFDQLHSAVEAVDSAVAQAQGISLTLRHYGAPDQEQQTMKSALLRAEDIKSARPYIRACVDRALWTHLIDRSGMRRLMDRQALEEFERSIRNDPPEGSIENVTATFETLTGNVRHIFLRGLANALSNLDRRFKSHSTFKFKNRVILNNVVGSYNFINMQSRALRTINDIERAMSVALGLGEHMVGETSTRLQREYPAGLEPATMDMVTTLL